MSDSYYADEYVYPWWKFLSKEEKQSFINKFASNRTIDNIPYIEIMMIYQINFNVIW